MFCPRCGRPERLFDGLCKSCFIEENPLINVPDEIKVTVCSHCNSYILKGKWRESKSEEEIAFEVVKENIKLSDFADDVDVSIETFPPERGVFTCIIHAKGKILGQDTKEECKTNVKLGKAVCSECSKFLSGYYEAVIQIRADNRFPSKKEIGTIDKFIINNIKKISEKNKMAYISERVEKREGIDYYVGSYKIAKRLTAAIKDALGGVVGESPKLMGKDRATGKNLYRVWISLRLPWFRKGDFIAYKDSIWQIMSITGKKILSKDLSSPNKLSIPWRDYKKINVIAKKEDIKEAIVTAKTPKTIQILHPETYQPIEIQIHEGISDFDIGKEVAVVEIEDNFYILQSNLSKKS